MPGRGNSALDKSDVGANWPLIRYLLDDPTYYAAYIGHLRSLAGELFPADALAARCEHLAGVIAPYVAPQGDEEAFRSAVDDLIARTAERAAVLQAFVAAQ